MLYQRFKFKIFQKYSAETLKGFICNFFYSKEDTAPLFFYVISETKTLQIIMTFEKPEQFCICSCVSLLNRPIALYLECPIVSASIH